MKLEAEREAVSSVLALFDCLESLKCESSNKCKKYVKYVQLTVINKYIVITPFKKLIL